MVDAEVLADRIASLPLSAADRTAVRERWERILRSALDHPGPATP